MYPPVQPAFPVQQETIICSERSRKDPGELLEMAYRDSKAPTLAKAQQEPQLRWSLTGETKLPPWVRQSSELGSAATFGPAGSSLVCSDFPSNKRPVAKVRLYSRGVQFRPCSLMASLICSTLGVSARAVPGMSARQHRSRAISPKASLRLLKLLLFCSIAYFTVPPMLRAAVPVAMGCAACTQRTFLLRAHSLCAMQQIPSGLYHGFSPNGVNVALKRCREVTGHFVVVSAGSCLGTLDVELPSTILSREKGEGALVPTPSLQIQATYYG